MYHNSKKWHFEGAVIFYTPNTEKHVGFTTSKKVGNAVKRNRARRRLKALFLELQPNLSSGSYVIVAKDKIHDLDYATLKKGLLWSFGRLNCLEK